MFDNEQNKYVDLESKVYVKYLGVLIDKNLSILMLLLRKLVKMLGLLQNYVIMYLGKYY